jgi:hypothetical protein
MADLEIYRGELQSKILDLDLPDGEARGDPAAIEFIKTKWVDAKLLIDGWWGAYKEWEGKDTFNEAVSHNRMTMRSFGVEFDTQVKKTAPMNIAEESRFYSDSSRTKVADPATHQSAFNAIVSGPKAPVFGWKKGSEPKPSPYAKLNRGIDTSAFAVPANFLSREAKYKHGLHDLSVKLIVPNQNVKEQSHHKGSLEPHFCFMPISKPEDQSVIYTLIRYAKALRTVKPEFDTLIRGYRSEMTRVKLAHDYDMGTGLVAVETPGRVDNLPYKVSYSLGDKTKRRSEDGGGEIPVTAELVRMRKQAYFKENARVIRTGNEFVIAMRKHAGQFPVYAVYAGGTFNCYTIGGDNKPNPLVGKTISANGVANW